MDIVSENAQDLIARVHPGMTVVDITGEAIGIVDLVRMGDPEAVTSRGQSLGPDNGFFHTVASVLRGIEPDVPPVIAERLRRTGFVKIGVRGLFARNRYAAPEQVAGVEGGTVYLSASGTGLPRKS